MKFNQKFNYHDGNVFYSLKTIFSCVFIVNKNKISSNYIFIVKIMFLKFR